MKLKTKVSLILIFLVIAVCSLFAACQIGGKSWQDILGDAQHQYITYYAGGGTFGNNKVVRDIYYPADKPAVSEFEGTNQSVTRTDWLFKGWYYVECDSEGNPEFASEDDKKAGIPVLSDRQAVFPLTLQKNDHLYLGAKWTRDYKLKYFLYDSPEITIDQKTYKNGEEIATNTFGTYDYINVTYDNLPVKSSDSTLLEYYTYNEETETYEVLSGSVNKPSEYDETVEDPYVAVYCKFVSGVWEMVRTASDVRNMYNNMAYGNSYYVTKNIDCSSNLALALKNGSINCTIQGNGYTLSNQKFETNNLGNGLTCSVFGEISKDTVIKDITFENFNAKVTIRGARVNIYLFSHKIENGATLENVQFNNSELNIPKIPNNTVINNIQYVDGNYQSDRWIYGEGDYSAVKFSNLTLNVVDKTYNKYQEN